MNMMPANDNDVYRPIHWVEIPPRLPDGTLLITKFGVYLDEVDKWIHLRIFSEAGPYRDRLLAALRLYEESKRQPTRKWRRKPKKAAYSGRE